MTTISSKIYNKYERNLPCPCDSSKKAKNCCLKPDNSWFKKKSNLTPLGSQTNYINEKCYCSITKNCDDKITREHYISKCVLRYISSDSKTTMISGLPWIPNNEKRPISIESLVSKTLCERHNNTFSSLDSEACRLFNKIGEYDASFLISKNSDQVAIFSGEDLELWMLKTICGFISAKQIGVNNKIKNTKIKSEWIDILCGKIKWPENWGLYINLRNGDEMTLKSKNIAFSPKLNINNDELIGAEILINNIHFTLLLEKFENVNMIGVHRPRLLIFQHQMIKKHIELSWQNSSYTKCLTFMRGEQDFS